MVAILVGVRWYLIVALIFISLMINTLLIAGGHLTNFQDNRFESQAFEELRIPNPSSPFIILRLAWSS